MENINKAENFSGENKKNIDEKENKKIKNLISLVILLSGLFLGSLFLDFGHLLIGSGFSQKNLKKSDIFEADGKTWVTYGEPVIPVRVINDDQCEDCDVSEILVWMKRVIPTIASEKISHDSEEGKKLMEKFQIKSVPAFVFSKSITSTDFYSQADVLFNEKENDYFLKGQELGLPVGRYIETPSISDSDASAGPKDSKVKVIIYSDYSSPYSKVFWNTFQESMKDYKDKVLFVQKDIFSSDNVQSGSAAMAAQCALEQGKFWEYSEKLLSSQADWNKIDGTKIFKNYASTLDLSSDQFGKCLDEKKYQEKLENIRKEADDFSVSEAPVVFVNDKTLLEFSPEELKGLIDSGLNK